MFDIGVLNPLSWYKMMLVAHTFLTNSMVVFLIVFRIPYSIYKTITMWSWKGALDKSKVVFDSHVFLSFYFFCFFV